MDAFAEVPPSLTGGLHCGTPFHVLDVVVSTAPLPIIGGLHCGHELVA
jgi:hypothetical protein